MQRTWVLVVVLGCGGGSKQAATTPPPPAHTCAKAADHMIDMLPANTKDAPPEQVKGLKDAIVGHCTNDSWSPDVIACVDGAAKPEDIGKCDELLTPAQRDSLAKDSGEAAPADTKQKATPKKGGDPEEGGE